MIIDTAKDIATRAYFGTFRKGNNKPYIVHPAAVAKLVSHNGGTEEMIAAAWCHDVMEDCPDFIKEVNNKLPTYVVELIDELTKPVHLDKNIWLKKMTEASIDAFVIKMADRLDNLSEPESMSASWLIKYLKQTKIILEVAEVKSLGSHQLFKLLSDRYSELEGV